MLQTYSNVQHVFSSRVSPPLLLSAPSSCPAMLDISDRSFACHPCLFPFAGRGNGTDETRILRVLLFLALEIIKRVIVTLS